MGRPNRDPIFPWEDVNASREDDQLQAVRSATKARTEYGDQANPCPDCDCDSEDLEWFYFRSPEVTWEMLCGREGWMTLCVDCHRQVDFFLVAMN